jgi:hypothetical protein
MLLSCHITRKSNPDPCAATGVPTPAWMGHWTRRAVQAALLLSFASLSPGRSAAQRPTASIVGQVVERQTGAPVEGALVRLTWTGRAARTDSAGRFELGNLMPGAGLLQARAVGHRLGSWAVLLAEGTVLTDTLELEAIPVELSELVVPGVPQDDWRSAEGFEQRRRKGGGYFITEQQILQQRPNSLAEALRQVPGVLTVCGFRGCQVRMVRTRAGCAPDYFLDGFPATLATGPDFPIQGIRGIEIYPDEFAVPSEFQKINLRCGIIAIWTKMER